MKNNMNNNTLIIAGVVVAVVIVGFLLMNKQSEVVPLVPETEEVMKDQVQNEQTELLQNSTSATVILSAVTGNEAMQEGTALLQETNDGLMVTVSVTGYSADDPQPMHIHVGGCPGVGSVQYPLESLVNGKSTTTLAGVTLEQLNFELPLAINVHKSADESSVYTACGDVVLE